MCKQEGKEGSCYTNNVAYVSECTIYAKEENKEIIHKYIGET